MKENEDERENYPGCVGEVVPLAEAQPMSGRAFSPQNSRDLAVIHGLRCRRPAAKVLKREMRPC